MKEQNAPPQLSIIVATYNAAATLERCLASIVEQSFTGWELVIADGGSTDGTLDIIRSQQRHIAHWRSAPDKGIYDAWNAALGRTRGEYITFLGADDRWHARDSLERIFHAIADRPIDLVTSRGCLVDRHGIRYAEFGSAWDYHKVMRKMTICHPGALHRRDLFDRFGLFDTSYHISADYEFLLRLPCDLQTLHLDAPLVDVADGGVSRQRRWPMLMERFRAQRDCPRIGTIKACANLADKMWRIPVAKVLGITN